MPCYKDIDIEAMLRKIKVKELKAGDVYAHVNKYLEPHVVIHTGTPSWSDKMVRITFGWINKVNGYYSQECTEVLGNETEIYKFII